MPEKILFIPRQQIYTRKESVALDWLIYEAGGEVCVWFDTSAMIFSLAPEQIPGELRIKGSLYAATDIGRLGDLALRCPDLRMAIGMFRSFVQRREIMWHGPAPAPGPATAMQQEP